MITNWEKRERVNVGAVLTEENVSVPDIRKLWVNVETEKWESSGAVILVQTQRSMEYLTDYLTIENEQYEAVVTWYTPFIVVNNVSFFSLKLLCVFNILINLS